MTPSDTNLSVPALMVNNERCEMVITEVQNNTVLEHVDVSDNHFDNDTGGPGCVLLLPHMCTILNHFHAGSNLVGALCHTDKLQSICLSRNGCGGISTCRALGRILVTHSLTSLMLSGMNNPILDENGPSIVSGIRFCRSLCVLDLSANLIGDTTMFEFETACLNHPKLRTVNLEGNVISDQGAYCLSKVSRQFQSLNVSHNKIGQSGIAALLASLGVKHCRLESLYVHRNDFEDTNASGGVGSNGIAENTTLRTLSVSFMKMVEANSLGAGLIMNKFLVSIDFSNNELECNSVQFMTNIVANQHLEFVDFSSNRIRTRGALWILKGLAEKIRAQSKRMIEVRLHKNFYNEQLNDVLNSMNNRELSAALRIQRCVEIDASQKQILTSTFRAESAINNFERDQIVIWTKMDTQLFDLRVLLAYGNLVLE